MVLSSNKTLLSRNLLVSLNPKDWPIKITDLPRGSALVGGSVRDGLLNRLSSKPDLDFVLPTNAIEFTQNLSTKINATFIKLDEKRDIARLSVGGWTLDFAAQIGRNLEDDLFRRDFRINAIALRFGDEPKLFDPTGGLEDLINKKIVAINEKNLIDDPLRIVRGFRLMCELDFELEHRTKCFLKSNKNKLNNVAPERIKTEVMKIVNSEWNNFVWKTYLEIQLFQNWNDERMGLIELSTKNNLPVELLDRRPLARLICLLSQEGLSKLTFSKNQIKRCHNLRFWLLKINSLGLESFTEDERFQLHIDLGDDLPALIFFLKDKYFNRWLERWRDPSDPLFHPSCPLDGNILKKALNIPSSPSLGELMRHLSKEKAYGRYSTNLEALEAARKWTLENSPLL